MKKNLKIAVCFILCISLSCAFFTDCSALSKYGSRGNQVREIQRRLKKWKYYKGSVDGIYGKKTRTAVRKFQKKNKLKVDGIAGKRTLAKMGINSKKYTNNNSKSTTKKAKTVTTYKNTSDVNLLAKVISAEARGESYKGQVAVGAVILNRVSHSSFPDTISGVVYQNGAFSCMYDGQINAKTTDSAYRAAKEAINGWDPSGGAIYYYNPKTAKSSWIRKRPVILTIGNHIFCK